MSLVQASCPSTQTLELLGQMLTAFRAGHRFQFFCEPGDEPKIIQRLRSKLSKIRRSMRTKGKRYRRFGVHYESYPYTIAGKRFVAVVARESRSLSHIAAEHLEDICENLE